MLTRLPTGTTIDTRAHITIEVPQGNANYVDVWEGQRHQRLGPYLTRARALRAADEIAERVNEVREKERPPTNTGV